METKKTWGRELAFCVLIWFAYIVESKEIEYTEILVLPVFSLVFATFGLKRITSDTQLWKGSSEPTDWRGSEPSGQYTSGERKHPDDREFYTAGFRPTECNPKPSRPTKDFSQT